MQEHIRRAHPDHYIPKLPATEESFQLMVNTPPDQRPHQLPPHNATTTHHRRGLLQHIYLPFEYCADLFQPVPAIGASSVAITARAPPRLPVPWMKLIQLPLLQLLPLRSFTITHWPLSGILKP